MSYTAITRALRAAGNETKVVILKRFFKTGKGEYGYGDRFIGVTVPEQRAIARQYRTLDERSLTRLLTSPIHEYRLTALIILVDQFARGESDTKTHLYQYYLSHTTHINNWDLVDTSAHHIVGEYTLLHPSKRQTRYELARSPHLWEQRIAIVSTLADIRAGHYDDTLKISKMLLAHPHDLIHKAVGWMLREVGKRDRKILLNFLTIHATHMPRTALRYALEHCTDEEKHYFMRLTPRS